MGYGDQLMATGMAKGAKARGKRIAFGDATKILWDHYSNIVFPGNPNIALPGSEQDPDIEWLHWYRGSRFYNKQDKVNNRWIWKTNFKPIPGEMFLTPKEMLVAKPWGQDYIIVEPYSTTWKLHGSNKQWIISRYIEVIRRLVKTGHRVLQFTSKAPILARAEQVLARDFREACAIMSKAKLFIGSEGGLHHAAAAYQVPAVVIFGGWIPPAVTGYDFHINIARGEACGSLFPCPHCQQVMESITVEEVLEATQKLLKRSTADVVI
jgi:ADP-heptose:LPS heptosyltransferase